MTTYTHDDSPPLPRLSSRVFRDLAMWMVGFGLLIGVLFPLVVMLAGVPRDIALRPGFFTMTLVAGLAVGAVNHALARAVVGHRLRMASKRMREVADAIETATIDGEWARCSPEACELPQDSDDELGEVAGSFNRLIEALADSRSAQDAQFAYAHAMAAHLDLADLGDETLHRLLAFAGADAGALVLTADGQQRPLASHRMEAASLTDSTLLVHALKDEAPTMVEVPDGVVIDATVVDFVPSAVVIAPLRFGNSPLAVLALAFGRRPNQDRLRTLEQLVDPTAVALHNALTHERFQRLAAIDPLTGAYNRRFGLERLSEELSRAIRATSPLGILTFDLDHFKRINDTFGHLAGDQVLREVVRSSAQALRAGDVLIRTGGEEFVALLPGAGLSDVTEVGERIREAVSSTVIHLGRQDVRITVSVGGASYPDTPADQPEQLLELADQALYRAKRSGRDRVIVHRPERGRASRETTAVAAREQRYGGTG